MNFSRILSYPTQYQGALPIGSQIRIIADAFSLDPNPVFALANRPTDIPLQAEGVFAIPRFDKVAQDYEGAVRCVQSKIKEAHALHIGSRDLDPQHLERTSRNSLAYVTFVDRCPDSDILLVPAQFGQLHAGKSVEVVRRIVGSSRVEFGLGLFEVLCMLLTHPARLASERALAIDVPGDQHIRSGSSVAHHAPVVDRSGTRLIISSALISSADPHSGSVTGFLG